MTSREIIQRVLSHDHPERVGLTYSGYGEEPRLSDVAWIGPAGDPEKDGSWQDDDSGGEVSTDEWGCVWRRLKGKTKGGEVIDPPIKTWDDLDSYQLPSLDDPARYEQAAKLCETNTEHYILGGLAGVCFDRARYLRKLENYLRDCAGEPEQVTRLNRLVSGLIVRQVDIYADIGAHGVVLCEDWGTQERLLVSPRMWDELFRWTFEAVIERAHARGLTVWMHSCGYVKDIIPTLVDMGLDVFQFDQPELHGLDWLAQFSGRVTYWCPVDIQSTLQCGDEGTIRAKAREMLRTLGGKGGGFIAKDYPDNESIGVEALWQHWGYEEFVRCGTYAPDGSLPDAG